MRSLLLALAAGACGYLVGARDSRHAVMEADREFDRAASTERIEGWVRFFAPDGKMVRSDGTLVAGQDAVRKLMTPLFSEPRNSLRWKPDFAEVSRSGDLGYTTGPAVFTGVGADGAAVERDSRYVTVWRKTKEGWRVAIDIGTGGTPRKAQR